MSVLAVTAPRPRAHVETTSVLLRSGDLDLLVWVAEQYAARVDQLAVLAGCGPRTIQRTLARLRADRLIETSRLLADQPAWVIPTAKGLRACESPYGVWRPRLGLIAHVGAVNDVRLHVQARDRCAEWVCERQLARQRSDRHDHLPDAVVLSSGKHVAIEVELTPKSRRRLEQILDRLNMDYEQTVYFCGPAPYRLLTELLQSERWPNVGVRTLPSDIGGPA